MPWISFLKAPERFSKLGSPEGSKLPNGPLSALVETSSSSEKQIFAVTQEAEAKERGINWGAEWRWVRYIRDPAI